VLDRRLRREGYLRGQRYIDPIQEPLVECRTSP